MRCQGSPPARLAKAGSRPRCTRQHSNGRTGTLIEEALSGISEPAVILVGRPYAAYAPEVNLSVPRKISTRGFTVIPGDALWPKLPHTQHRLRHELEGRPFCFLEIDSHTAHAGIETRVGAFLDIVEASRRRPVSPAPPDPRRATAALLEQDGIHAWIVTGSGRRVELDDPQVEHVSLADGPQFLSDIGFIEILEQRWRRIAAESGLLFSPHVPFGDVEREGHRRISLNGFTEAPLTIGRYATLLATGAFDGYVNIGAFNCAPSNTASAVIHALSLRTDTPYAVIESDGDSITAGQLRQLETVAVQCRRGREAISERLST